MFRTKTDGTSISMWLTSLSMFCGSVYKKYNIGMCFSLLPNISVLICIGFYPLILSVRNQVRRLSNMNLNS